MEEVGRTRGETSLAGPERKMRCGLAGSCWPEEGARPRGEEAGVLEERGDRGGGARAGAGHRSRGGRGRARVRKERWRGRRDKRKEGKNGLGSKEKGKRA